MHQSSLQDQTHEYITLTPIERQFILFGNFSFLNGVALPFIRTRPSSNPGGTRTSGTTVTLRVQRSERKAS